MARPLRLAFPGALYHVTARRNERKRDARHWVSVSHELRCGRELLCRGEGWHDRRLGSVLPDRGVSSSVEDGENDKAFTSNSKED